MGDPERGLCANCDPVHAPPAAPDRKGALVSGRWAVAGERGAGRHPAGATVAARHRSESAGVVDFSAADRESGVTGGSRAGGSGPPPVVGMAGTRGATTVKGKRQKAKIKMKPIITVVIPTLDRPDFAKVATDSVLFQEGNHVCEIVVSNNGANKKTREIFSSEFYKEKIKYLETNEVLPMTKHWEWASGFSSGKYMMILPDRRLLKQGAINKLINIMEKYNECDCCCCCDEWLFESGRLASTKTLKFDKILSSSEILTNFELGEIDTNILPLGLNSIIRKDVVDKFRKQGYIYFDAISPDFRSAFNFLFSSERNVYVVSDPLMITTGFKLSNGGRSYKGDKSYLETLGQQGSYSFMPKCFEGNVWGSIFEDYLRAKHSFIGDGDYKKIMSNNAMYKILTEELVKVAYSGFSRQSVGRYYEIRQILKDCGWRFNDDLKAIKNAVKGWRSFIPDSIKKPYRLICSHYYGKKEILQVAGFS